jgi:hypothetical protein
MSQCTLDKTIEDVEEDQRTSTKIADLDFTASTGNKDIAGLLSRMTLAERIRAYRSGVFSRRELSDTAAREPDRMPIRNDEFEWIALSLADLD